MKNIILISLAFSAFACNPIAKQADQPVSNRFFAETSALEIMQNLKMK